MERYKQFVTSTVGRKVLMGLTGLGLVIFVAGHLLGNLQLLLPAGTMFNAYAHKLVALGPALWVIEAGLAAVILVHAVVGFLCRNENRSARSTRYEADNTKGGESKKNLSSQNMFLFGLVILIFIVLHVLHFKFGAHYTTTVHGEQVRDLFLLVVEEFQKPHIVLLYVIAMLALGFHLRHGIWSMLQSLGAMPRAISSVAYAVLGVVGGLLALGFLVLPVWIFFDPTGGYRDYLAKHGKKQAVVQPLDVQATTGGGHGDTTERPGH